jgi:hypothetical protein
MNTRSKHVQFSLLTGLILMTGLTISFANADSTDLPSALRTFVMTNPNDSTNGAFAGAKFDIAGFMSHPCYEMTGTEVQMCADQYGITEPLKTYVENGELLSWLTQNGLMPTDPFASFMSSVSTASSASSASSSDMSAVSSTSSAMSVASTRTTVLNSAVDTEQDFNALRAARAAKLWTICMRKYGTRNDTALCYQNNIHLLMRLDVELEGNVN